ncbi:MAG TPA: ABC transporter substrate-binding protein [Bradyrhizobium sp.]|jgi:putative ABC transport system substrate-binding protein|nr:ABC transporter substrate-binding protein [Bradyrhizobium sp.]
MKRREFIALLCASLARPTGVAAQATPVIGYLGSASAGAWQDRLKAFREGLSEAGFVDGRNVTIEYRWADNQYDRLPGLASDLVRRGVAVIVTPASAPAALAAQAATKTIPVVFETGADPVTIGLVSSLSRPGGNITGITASSFALGPKRLELLREVVPSAKLFAILVNPAAGDIAARQTQELETAARTMGLELLILRAGSDPEITAAFSTLLQQRAAGLVIVPEVFSNSRREQIGGLALQNGVPAIFQSREFAAAGGLLSYGGNIAETHRLTGIYAGRVLKGERPSDLPVIQGTKAELVVNLKTAKALGLQMPLSLLGRAEEVIE